MNFAIRTALGVLLISAAAWAQSTGQISGTVRDTTGGSVPGSAIKVAQTATGVVRTVTSGPDGGYVLTNLSVGPYLLEVSKDGFSKYVQSGILLQVDSNPTVDVALKVGAVTEQVTVGADAEGPLRHVQITSITGFITSDLGSRGIGGRSEA